MRDESAGFTQLSDIEASYLFRERQPGTWLTGTIVVFDADDAALTLAALRTQVRARLDLVPVLRRRVVHMPGDLTAPVLEDDPDFDVDRHVVAAPGGEDGSRSAVVAAASKAMSGPVDLDHPPWQILLVGGSPGQPAGLVAVVHHVYGGALDQVPMMMGLLVDGFDDPDTPHDHPWVAHASMTTWQRLRRTAVELGHNTRGFLTELRHDVREGSLHDVADLTQEVGEAMRAVSPSDLFQGELSEQRSVALADVPMDVVGAARHAFGFRATINDIALAGMAGGIRRYLRARGEPLSNPIAHLPAVPHTMPGSGTGDDAVAMVTGSGYAMLVELPVVVDDPTRRLALLARAMSRHKAAAATDEIRKVDALFNFAFPPLQARETELLHGVRARNFGFTNAPGPVQPMHVQGRRITGGYMLKHLKGDQGLGAGVISLAGVLHVGLIADPHVLPGLATLADGIREELLELADLATR